MATKINSERLVEIAGFNIIFTELNFEEGEVAYKIIGKQPATSTEQEALDSGIQGFINTMLREMPSSE